MKKVAVVYITHDGFTSLYTGVGTVSRDFLLSFPLVASRIKKTFPKVDLELFATTLKYNDKCFGYSEEVKKKTALFISKHRKIHLIELINGSSGTKSYGYIDLWKNACISAATFIYGLNVLGKYDKIIVVCVDTPFAQVANYFFAQYSHSNVMFVWLPQSTVLIHKIDSGLGKVKVKNYTQERYEWEKKVIDLAKNTKQVQIGYVGEFMKNHLIEKYNAKKMSLISLRNGLNFKRLASNRLSQKELAQIIRKLGIPLDRPLLFSFGRAESYKGLDLIIKNANVLVERYGYFVFILASPYSMQDPYLKVLDKLAVRLGSNIKIIYDLDFLTPHYLMQWHNTKILALMSRAEPYGLIPTEARFYRNPNLVLLASNIDGFKEQIENGRSGFLTDLDSTSIRHSFLKLAGLSANAKKALSIQGYKKAIKLNQIDINTDFLINALRN